MKGFFLIQIDSVIDLITNSSSELFVCKTDKTIDFVRSFLQELLNGLYYPQSFSYTFDEPVLITKENLAELFFSNSSELRNAAGLGVVDELNPENYLGYYYQSGKEGLTSKTFARYKSAFYNYYNDFPEQFSELIGRVIIRSASDNSIPYDLLSEIEKKFDAKRYYF